MLHKQTNTKMKTYESIKNSSQVKEGDILVEFYFNSNEIWHSFKVDEVRDNGIMLYCPSRALLFIENKRLDAKSEYFKRVI